MHGGGYTRSLGSFGFPSASMGKRKGRHIIPCTVSQIKAAVQAEDVFKVGEVELAQSALIFKDVKIRGFWVTQWKRNHSQDEEALRAMLDELCSLVRDGKLSAPACTEHSLRDFQKALVAAMQPYTSAKQVVVM